MCKVSRPPRERKMCKSLEPKEKSKCVSAPKTQDELHQMVAERKEQFVDNDQDLSFEECGEG